MITRAIKNTFWLILCTITLSACGFHLPGKQALPQRLHILHLQSARFTDLTRHLRAVLMENGVTLVDAQNDASVTLHILQESRGQETKTIGSSQQTHEYNLNYTVIFELLDNKGRPLTNTQHVLAERSQVLQTSQILGATEQTEDLYNNMIKDAVRQIMDRLSSPNTKKQLDKKI